MKSKIVEYFKSYLILPFTFFFASLLFATEIIVIVASQESVEASIGVFRYIIFALLVLSVFVFLSNYLAKCLQNLIFSLFITLSFFSLKLSIFPAYFALPAGLTYLIFIFSVLFAHYFLIKFLQQNFFLSAKFWIVISFVFAFVPLSFIYVKSLNPKSDTEHFGLWRDVRFKSKPNIYLLSFDSMIPKDTYKDYLQGSGLGYAKVLLDKYIEVPNSLSIQVPTQASLNSVMRLDQSIQPLTGDLFAGRKDSILARVLKDNGYLTNTGFASYYFGSKGQFIDNYVTLGGVFYDRTTVCLDMGDSLKSKSRLLFFCKAYAFYKAIDKPDSLLKKFGNFIFLQTETNILYDNWRGRVIDHIKSVPTASNPVFTFLYTYSPVGHTPLDYNHDVLTMRTSYKHQFDRSAEMLGEFLEDVFSTIFKYDPYSIVIVFGDHGAWLSRMSNPKTDAEFIYRDRHRVLLATMRTKSSCSNPSRTYSQIYSTPSRLLLDLFLCLGVDRDNLNKILSFDEPEVVLNNVFPNYSKIQ